MTKEQFEKFKDEYIDKYCGPYQKEFIERFGEFLIDRIKL